MSPPVSGRNVEKNTLSLSAEATGTVTTTGSRYNTYLGAAPVDRCPGDSIAETVDDALAIGRPRNPPKILPACVTRLEVPRGRSRTQSASFASWSRSSSRCPSGEVMTGRWNRGIVENRRLPFPIEHHQSGGRLRLGAGQVDERAVCGHPVLAHAERGTKPDALSHRKRRSGQLEARFVERRRPSASCPLANRRGGRERTSGPRRLRPAPSARRPRAIARRSAPRHTSQSGSCRS